MWEAENVPKKSKGEISSSPRGTISSSSRISRSSETPEAAMARLTSSYSDAMTLTHALHSLSKKIAKEKESLFRSNGYDADSEEQQHQQYHQEEEHNPRHSMEKRDKDAMRSLLEAAHKARDTFHSKLIFDPLLKPYAKHTLSHIRKYSTTLSSFTDTNTGAVTTATATTATTNTATTDLFFQQNDEQDNDYSSFTSLAHINALKQLMYTTLVNYADLLLVGICHHDSHDEQQQQQQQDDDDDHSYANHDIHSYNHKKEIHSHSILHRGIVPTLAALVQQSCSNPQKIHTCWEAYGESIQQTIRLALIAYCDASDIDASDPILWLKLACVARRLSISIVIHETDRDHSHDNIGYSSWYHWEYARLERYAIERGMMTLKQGLPPNRSILKAFQEMEEDGESTRQYFYNRPLTSIHGVNHHDSAELQIDLPKYSWVTLGRYLLHACKDPNQSTDNPPGMTWMKSWKASYRSNEDFGSPMVRIQISPLLIVPHGVLVHICDYLGSYTTMTATGTTTTSNSNSTSAMTTMSTESKRPSQDIIMLESTSRCISIAISNARSLVEKDKNKRIRRLEHEMQHLMKTTHSEQNDEAVSIPDSKQNRNHPTMSSSASQRSSARVRSNLITSSKQAERSAKRKNLEYCLVGALLQCTSDHPLYSSMVNVDLPWDTLACFSALKDEVSFMTTTSRTQLSLDNDGRGVLDVLAKRSPRNHSLELRDFVAKWTGANSGPSQILHHFINHISNHVEELYATELGSASNVTQCIMECYEYLSKDCSSTNSILPCWFGRERLNVYEYEVTEAMQDLATNLLFLELKMRSAEQKSATCYSFMGDIHIVRTSLPILLQLCENLDELAFNDDTVKNRYAKLKTRTFFLAATFYVWWSRHTDQGSEIKELETLALDFIDKVVHLLESQSELQPFTIETKHLASVVRTGDIWSQLNIMSITRYKDEFQFCTVLSRVRESFSALVSTLKKNGNDYFEIPSNGPVRDSFESIKQDLFSRYSLDAEFSTSSFDELVDDFISLHISNLMEWRDRSTCGNDDDSVSDFQIFLPSSSNTRVPLDKLSSPSVLTMILLCYHQTSDNYGIDLVKCLTRLVFVSLDKRKGLLNGADSIDLTTTTVDDSDSGEEMDIISSKTSDPRVYMRMLNLVLTIIIEAVMSMEGDAIVVDQSKLLMKVINAAFDASICYSASQDNITIQRVSPDIDCLQCLNRLVYVMINKGDNSMKSQLSSFIFALLTKCIVYSRTIFVQLVNSKLRKISRSECHRLVISRAKVVAVSMTEVAALLTNKNIVIDNGDVQESFLILALATGSPSEPIYTPLAQLIESLAWFWEFSKSASSTESQYTNLTNTVHKSAAKYMLVPSSSLTVSLCSHSLHGLDTSISESFINKQGETYRDTQHTDHASDYFDSDDSAVKWAPGYISDSEATRKRRLLQSLKKAVQCIGLVYLECYENGMSSAFVSVLSPMNNVPDSFSYIVIQSLTSISDFVLNAFSQHDNTLGIWADDYPVGFQTSGMQLDLLLHKAYYRLYGVQLTAPHFYSSIPSDASVPSMNFSASESEPEFVPVPSVTTVVQFYRCLRRAYSNGRRVIPSELLDFISSNLPPPDDESESVKAIKSFLFTSREKSCTAENADLLLDSRNNGISELGAEFPLWIFSNSSSLDTLVIDSESSAPSVEKEINTVRKGLWEYIAEKATTTISHSTTMDDNNQDLSDQMQERTIISCKIEKSADEKVFAIIHALHYEPTDASKWFRMANAIGLKLNHICDRLIPAEASYDVNQFCVQQVASSEQRNDIWKKMRGHPKSLSKLLVLQKIVYNQVEKRRNRLRNIDLSGFVEHQWSSVDSIRSLEKKLQRIASGHDKKVLQRLQTWFDQGEYSKWQFEWGLHFINALRAIQQQCFDVALYLAQKRSAETEDENIVSDISEAYATTFYDTIGFNPEPITIYEKRQRAMRAKMLFEAALSSQLATSKACKTSEIMPTWEIRFMIGKCYEKIANTVDQEEYSQGENVAKRHYERLMMKALESYYEAYIEAKQFRDNGNVLDAQGGGSTNGLVEYSYRLHASRLKILIAAVKKPSSERKAALMEASRLLEHFWFDANHDTIFDDAKLLDRIWIVFCDIISALASFRKVQAFFHRSVYRHAQALMWAPVIHDPDGAVGGSSDTVPSFKSHRIPELSRHSNAFTAAESIMSVLFDKKRPQLCAVWVTTPSSPNPFERINDSCRKYDRLRCKYSGAYLECLGLCEKYHDIETFLSWVKSSRRDVPSFYHVTCAKRDSSLSKHPTHSIGSDTPNTTASMGLPLVFAEAPPHWKDNLLDKGFGLIFFIKKYANIIMCRMLLHRFQVTWKKQSTLVSDRNTKILQSNTIEDHDSIPQEKEGLDPYDMYYQLAYKCFLRLNSPLESNIWQTQRIKGMMESHQILEVDCLIAAHDIWLSSHGTDTTTTNTTISHTSSSINSSSDLTRTATMAWDEILLQLYKSYQKANELYPTIQSEFDVTMKKIRRKRKSND